MTKHTVAEIAIEQIKPDPKQPRKVFNKAALVELSSSIKERGLKQPIVVESDTNGEYILVMGERRLRALKIAGFTSLRIGQEVIIRERSNHNGRDRFLDQMIENVQRENMNPIDEAEGYRSLHDTYDMSVEEISKQTGKHASWIYTAMLRLDVCPGVLELMRAGKLSADPRAITAYRSIEDPTTQLGLAQRAIERNMTIPAIVEYAKRINAALGADPVKSSKKSNSPAMNMAREKYQEEFGDDQPPQKWNALLQLGKAPPWPMVVVAANDTCGHCELRSMANKETCGRCPAVDIIGCLVNQVREIPA